MPHSTQYDVHESDAPKKAAAVEESSSRPNGFGKVHKRKGHQSSHALNPLDPYELDGTPVEQRQNAISSQYKILDMSPMLSEAKQNLEIALEEYKCLYGAYRRAGAWLEAQNIQLATTAQDALAQPPLVATPEHVPYEDFVRRLRNEGLMWLLEYVDQLDNTANFAVALTAEPTKKALQSWAPKR